MSLRVHSSHTNELVTVMITVTSKKFSYNIPIYMEITINNTTM